jgi:hypothetical protein
MNVYIRGIQMTGQWALVIPVPESKRWLDHTEASMIYPQRMKSFV